MSNINVERLKAACGIVRTIAEREKTDLDGITDQAMLKGAIGIIEDVIHSGNVSTLSTVSQQASCIPTQDVKKENSNTSNTATNISTGMIEHQTIPQQQASSTPPASQREQSTFPSSSAQTGPSQPCCWPRRTSTFGTPNALAKQASTTWSPNGSFRADGAAPLFSSSPVAVSAICDAAPNTTVSSFNSERSTLFPPPPPPGTQIISAKLVEDKRA